MMINIVIILYPTFKWTLASNEMVQDDALRGQT